MRADYKIFVPIIILTAAIFWLACNKPADGTIAGPTPYQLSYGDTILYLRSSGNIIYPTEHRDGTYSGFPEGIEIE